MRTVEMKSGSMINNLSAVLVYICEVIKHQNYTNVSDFDSMNLRQGEQKVQEKYISVGWS
jgi:hypothetical protein